MKNLSEINFLWGFQNLWCDEWDHPWHFETETFALWSQNLRLILTLLKSVSNFETDTETFGRWYHSLIPALRPLWSQSQSRDPKSRSSLLGHFGNFEHFGHFGYYWHFVHFGQFGLNWSILSLLIILILLHICTNLELVLFILWKREKQAGAKLCQTQSSAPFS